MSRTASPSVAQPYGVERVCRVWRMCRSAIYARRARASAEHSPRTRRGPDGPCPDAVLVTHIRRVIAHAPFQGEGYRKVWARLRHGSVRTSKERVRRLMREHHLQSPARPAAAVPEKAHDGTITTARPNLMWGTDMTTTPTVRDGQAAVFIAIDHCTAELVGVHASKRQDRFEALEPIRQAVRERFGIFEAGRAAGLQLRHDHGSNYMSDHFQKEISFLGIESSPAFVREPEGNGCAERFIRTLKEHLLWIRPFDTIEELRIALLEFQRLYNSQWILQRHGYRTPAQVFATFSGSTLACAA